MNKQLNPIHLEVSSKCIDLIEELTHGVQGGVNVPAKRVEEIARGMGISEGNMSGMLKTGLLTRSDGWVYANKELLYFQPTFKTRKILEALTSNQTLSKRYLREILSDISTVPQCLRLGFVRENDDMDIEITMRGMVMLTKCPKESVLDDIPKATEVLKARVKQSKKEIRSSVSSAQFRRLNDNQKVCSYAANTLHVPSRVVRTKTTVSLVITMPKDYEALVTRMRLVPTKKGWTASIATRTKEDMQSLIAFLVVNGILHDSKRPTETTLALMVTQDDEERKLIQLVNHGLSVRA